MTMHTPGPWRVDYSGDYVFASVDGETMIAAICSTTRDAVTGQPRWTNADDANARLIAAAPEMRALLEVFAKFAEDARHYDLTGRCVEARALLARIGG